MEDYTLLENLNIIKKFSDKKDEINLDYWLDFYDLWEHRNKKYKHLSLGTKQKMLLIQAFMTNPKTLILDECFSGLYEKSAQKTRDYIKRYMSDDKIIILTSHIRTDIEELCDEVISLHA
ncbi:ATP-binding cassette domain-containing protein [Gemella sp. GH3]|nr:ATP-binding cassette domain-containing protein [Gemella sp. GH3.1]NYS50448.1 ATP-binding cassette domain-containing protein [Gemella sp. GH3]